MNVLSNKAVVFDKFHEKSSKNSQHKGSSSSWTAAFQKKHVINLTRAIPSALITCLSLRGVRVGNWDLRSNHEEVHVIIPHQVVQLATYIRKIIKAISDDTDLFVLFAHCYQQCQRCVPLVLEPPILAITSANIGDTVKTPGYCPATAGSPCTNRIWHMTFACYSKVGKVKVIRVLQSGPTRDCHSSSIPVHCSMLTIVGPDDIMSDICYRQWW